MRRMFPGPGSLGPSSPARSSRKTSKRLARHGHSDPPAGASLRSRSWTAGLISWAMLLPVAFATDSRAYATVTTAVSPDSATKPEAIDAKVSHVTVYSDRALVQRTASVPRAGSSPRKITLPLLVGSVDPQSIRLASSNGEVLSVDIRYVDSSDLPVAEAEKLLASLEALQALTQKTQNEAAVYRHQLDLVRRLQPTVPPLPTADPQRGARLRATEWPTILGFIERAQERLQQKLAATEELLRDQRRQQQLLTEQARKLGGLTRKPGYLVTAQLSGDKATTLELSYQTAGARWQPTYDLQLWPAKNQVDLALSGLVSQETGEDWEDVSLVLSTAIPTQATQLPKLTRWKLGSAERFVPTPVAQTEPALPPPPRSSPPIALPQASSQPAIPVEELRRKLLLQAGLSDQGRRVQVVDSLAERDFDGIPDSSDMRADDDEAKSAEEPRKAAPRVMKPVTRNYQSLRGQAPAAPPPPPPPPPQEIAAFSATTTVAGVPMNGSSYGFTMDAAQSGSSDSLRQVSAGRFGNSQPRTLGVGMAPPPGYVPPRYASDLPASLAGGYDLALSGLYPETVKSGQGVRRVALLSRSFPVSVLRKVLPAVAPEAFLVAELKNPSTQPLPGGRAQLFVGADPAGVANLQTIAPGQTYTLPLGLDRALKPVRNVALVTTEKGVFNKDEVTEYTVTTELQNPYATAIDVELQDQVPLAASKDVELKLLRSDPPARHDTTTGALTFRLQLAPRAKLTTTFVYSLRRPKGYRLYQ